MNYPFSRPGPYALAKIWTCFVLFFLGVILFWQAGSYFELDAFGIWVLSCIGVLYLSRKPGETLSDSGKIWAIAAGAAVCLLGCISIPLGITNPPFSVGEFTILLSGFGLILFSAFRFRSLLLPVSLPFIAVLGYSGYELFLRNQDWLTEPLVPLTTWISVKMLNLIGIPTTSHANVFSFLSQGGQPIALTIVSDCTGVMSLGTFTVAVLIVFFSFSQAFSKTGMVWILAGYIGTYCVNILRIIMISLSGYYFGPAGVIEHVHVNIGWIIFSAWMIVFWYLFFTYHLGISFRKGSAGDSAGTEK